MPINPFADILRPYFDWLSKDFEHLANEAIRNDVNPDDITRDFLGDEGRRARFNQYMMPEIWSKVFEYWSRHNSAVFSELAKLPCLVCHFEKIFDIPSAKERVRLRRYLDSRADYFNEYDQ